MTAHKHNPQMFLRTMQDREAMQILQQMLATVQPGAKVIWYDMHPCMWDLDGYPHTDKILRDADKRYRDAITNGMAHLVIGPGVTDTDEGVARLNYGKVISILDAGIIVEIPDAMWKILPLQPTQFTAIGNYETVNGRVFLRSHSLVPTPGCENLG